MSSINTNASAMTALQTLNQIGKDLATTQSRISTGLRVGSASDNAAYWSISTTMKSDNGALSAVQDSLGLGAGKIDTAYTAMNSSIDTVNAIKEKLVTARGASADDRAKIQTEIKALQSDLASKALASFGGENLLNINSDDGDASLSIVSSYDRAGDGTTSVGTISVELLNTTSGDTVGLYDAGTTKAGILDTEFTTTGAGAVTTSVSALDITAANVDETDIDEMLAAVETSLSKMTDAASTLGAAKSRVDMQMDFVSNLSDAIDRGVGQLVDADMNEESARLSALQTQQQLGIQSLSIANSNSQNILSLFR